MGIPRRDGTGGYREGSQAGQNRAGSVPTFSTPLNDVDSPTRTGGGKEAREEWQGATGVQPSQGSVIGREGRNSA